MNFEEHAAKSLILNAVGIPTLRGALCTTAAEAAVAAKRVLRDWETLAREARECAIEVFDSAKNLRKILGI